MEGNRLNSRFQHTHKNKSIKAHGIMEGKSVIAQDRSRYFDKHESMAKGCQQRLIYAKPMTASNRISFYIKETAHHHLII